LFVCSGSGSLRSKASSRLGAVTRVPSSSPAASPSGTGSDASLDVSCASSAAADEAELQICVTSARLLALVDVRRVGPVPTRRSVAQCSAVQRNIVRSVAYAALR
jgi:hypothetical protein